MEKANSVKRSTKPFTSENNRGEKQPFTAIGKAVKGSRREFWLPIVAALATVAIVVCGVIFLPKLFATPLDSEAAEEAEYSKYYSLYEEVAKYNYAFGGSTTLEKKIKRALESEVDNVAGYFYYALAAAEYYYNVRDYNRALDYTDEAESYAATDTEWEFLIDAYLKIYKKLGNSDAVAYFEAMYDEYHVESDDDCSTDDTEDDTDEASE